MDSVSRNDQLIYPASAGLIICDDCEVTEMVKRYPLDTTVVCCPRLCQSAKLHNKTSNQFDQPGPGHCQQVGNFW